MPGDLNDVTALVAADHAYLRQLLDEVRRPTETPGVRRDLIEQLVSAWASHAAAERGTLDGEVGGDVNERVERVRSALDRLMADLRTESTDEQLSAIAELVDEHIGVMEREGFAALDADRRAALALRWTESIEAASGRTTPAR